MTTEVARDNIKGRAILEEQVNGPKMAPAFYSPSSSPFLAVIYRGNLLWEFRFSGSQSVLKVNENLNSCPSICCDSKNLNPSNSLNLGNYYLCEIQFRI